MAGIGCDECNCCSPQTMPPCTNGCCKCPPSGNICFDLLDCQAYYLAKNPVTLIDNWYPMDSCCTGMDSFTMTHENGYTLCREEGHAPSTTSVDGSTCLDTGTGPGQPTGTGTNSLPELWGWSGTVCGDCTTGPSRPVDMDPMSGWEDPYWHASGCGGMCVKASLCCCTSPFSGGSGFGPPGGHGNRCAQGASQPGRTGSCECGVTCYKFTMSPWECYDLPNTVLCPPASGSQYGPSGGTFPSACSPCSFLEAPMASSVYHNLPPLYTYTGCEFDCGSPSDVTGSNQGFWQVWSACEPGIAKGGGGCGMPPYDAASECEATCPNSSGTKGFMALVEGVYESQCDCATGVFTLMCGGPGTLYPSGVGLMTPAYVKFTALLSEC
jgi:hypothetical protein